ncbi:MAG TPA: hypothetical protein VEL51_05730 [Vicinamibacterales bacterium]|nr:hypothetical protein [Vicinamibacterales bacterium]
MEVSDVRRRLRGAIEDAKRRAADRRARADEASRAWQEVLPTIAVPAFHAMASALTGEGHRFKVLTPGDAVRLSPERSAEEFIELVLDTARDMPALMVHSTRGRGRRIISVERSVREGAAIAQLTQEDVVGILLEELVPFIER